MACSGTSSSGVKAKAISAFGLSLNYSYTKLEGDSYTSL